MEISVQTGCLYHVPCSCMQLSNTQDHYWCLFLNLVNMQVEKKWCIAYMNTKNTRHDKKNNPLGLKFSCEKIARIIAGGKNPMYPYMNTEGPFILRLNCVALPHCTLLHRNCDVTALRCLMKVKFILTWNVAMLRWLAAESNQYISTATQLGCSMNGP